MFPEVRDRLHPAWLARLQADWRAANRTYLGGGLKMPVLTIDVGVETRVGQWQRATRTLAISENHILQVPWEEVQNTLRHEMAHQYVDEVLRVTDETAHGPAFAQACRKLQVVAAARMGAVTALPAEADRILSKVKKLLALAESQNVHEAEAAMALANRMLLEYNLNLRDAEQHPGYSYRRVGAPLGVVDLCAKLVAAILTEFFFVEAIWVSTYAARQDKDLRHLEILGTQTNLELAHYVHDFLHRESEALWRQAQIKLTDRGRSAQREYRAGVLLGFRDKLRSERQASQERGLVWVGDPQLGTFYRERYPRVSSMRSAGVGHTDAHNAGRSAGQQLTLHRGVTATGPGGRLLGRS